MKKDKQWFVDKWIKERNKTDVHDPMYHFINEFIADINQIDEPEVPVIPQFVADWIEEAKDRKLTLYGAIHECPREVDYWLVDGDSSNQETFARAWLDGYGVEKDPKYYVLDKEGATLLKKSSVSEGVAKSVGTNISSAKSWKDEKKYRLTEQEIKDYDERFWPFAVKVEEMEE